MNDGENDERQLEGGEEKAKRKTRLETHDEEELRRDEGLRHAEENGEEDSE